MILNDFFEGIGDFKDYAPAIGATVNLEDLNASSISAEKQICNIITKPIYQEIKSGTDENLREPLKTALANLTLSKQVPFDALKLRKNNVAFYKNEQEASKRMYTENYFNAMDTLMQAMEIKDNWKETDFYKRRENLQVKSAGEFDSLYPIDLSHFYYYRTIPIQEEIIDEELSSYFELASGKETEMKRLKRALCMMVVASSMTRFDPIEMPASIRNLFDDTTASRSSEQEQERLKTIAGVLLKRATDIINSVDTILNVKDTTESVDTGNIDQNESDPFYLMT